MNPLTSFHPQTENTVTLVVTEVVGDNLCIATDDAQKVYEQIAAAFKEGKKVILSFKDAEDLTWPFLDDAIGQLYKFFPEEQIQSSLSFVDITPDDLEFIEDVVYWVKEYLKNPQRFKEAAREFLGDEDE
ncbi:STAS-like domain-containing protein [Aerosakkonema funiforme]|uniref:STAS-like domain-containing protein n=1 Tax=Aerosakkonema funiforme FACHB-1375 TaxID=2949571 RepID=A0A926VI90_9CYAN|nr:STAS-like domain-containing protein [Aerosakkonema funiforme]MBD2184466.1 STAS-like domain-containing protein [Aerosakkonema funiforme FACHB-1375]